MSRNGYTVEEVEAILGPDPSELHAFPKDLLIRLGTFPTCWSALHPNKRVWMTLDDEGAVVCPECLAADANRQRVNVRGCNCKPVDGKLVAYLAFE